MVPTERYHLFRVIRHLLVPVMPSLGKVRVLVRPPLYCPCIHLVVLTQGSLVHPLGIFLTHKRHQRLCYRTKRQVLHHARIFFCQHLAYQQSLLQFFLSFHCCQSNKVISNRPITIVTAFTGQCHGPCSASDAIAHMYTTHRRCSRHRLNRWLIRQPSSMTKPMPMRCSAQWSMPTCISTPCMV